MLSQKYNRNLIILKHLLMLPCKHGGNKNNSVHLTLFKKRKIFQFLFHIIIGTGKNQLVSSPCKNITDSFNFTAYGIGIDLWKDDTDQTCFFRTKCLCLGGRLITGLLDHFPDDCFLFTAYISVIQISGYSRSGNACKSGYFINIHIYVPLLLSFMSVICCRYVQIFIFMIIHVFIPVKKILREILCGYSTIMRDGFHIPHNFHIKFYSRYSNGSTGFPSFFTAK